MLCSLLFSKVRNNKARFHHQCPVHPERLRSQCSHILRSAVEYATLSLFCYGVKIIMGDPCRANFAVAEAVMQYAGCTSQRNVQGAGYFVERNASIFIDPTNSSLHFFFFCLPCGKCLISQTEKKMPTGKQLLLKEQVTVLQIAAQRDFLSRIVREWCVL